MADGLITVPLWNKCFRVIKAIHKPFPEHTSSHQRRYFCISSLIFLCLPCHYSDLHVLLLRPWWSNTDSCLLRLLRSIRQKEVEQQTFSFKTLTFSIMPSSSSRGWSCPSSFLTAVSSSTEAGQQAAECGFSTSHKLVSETRHRGFYSPVCSCIIESEDCLKPKPGHSQEATCRFDESIYCSGVVWEQKRDTGQKRSDRDKTMKIFMLHTLIYVDTYLYTVYKSPETSVICITPICCTHTYKT